MLTFLTRRLTVGMVGGALLVASLASECSAPIGNFVDTREVEAGMVCRFPWGIPKVLSVESGGVTAVLEWRVSFTILCWLHILWLTLNLMLWVVTFVRKHEVTWLAVVTTSIILAAILGGATKLAIYLDLKAAVSVLEGDAVRTGVSGDMFLFSSLVYCAILSVGACGYTVRRVLLERAYGLN